MKTAASPILFPGQASKRMGITVPDLVKLIKHYRYEFTEVKPGGKPGDKARNRWGLSEEQLDAIMRGQKRKWVEPEQAAAKAAPVRHNSPDGISRIPANRRTRLRPR